ncbi:hypothetical protein GMOD_00009932 [Pyrenophora seminiperda CCB06]|uniref:Uncharacterized protein n=1 Tax=Pyrenophora seminiperda CCB06 TaxID=1302712 RepID=A0A3M7M1P2_9PLEO|nr:hypothetical protein GMOD_00009932 [Pyrenophora seminiperda CCB06]
MSDTTYARAHPRVRLVHVAKKVCGTSRHTDPRGKEWYIHSFSLASS